MKILLLSAVLGLNWRLRVRAEVGTQPNFDSSKFSGMWNIIVMGSNDKVFLSKKDSMKMATAIVAPASNGDLNIKFGFPNPEGGCQIMDSVFVKGAVPGQFSDADFNQKKIHVVKTDYKRYAILYMQVERDGVTSNMLQLYTRGKDLVAEAVLKMQMMGPKLKLYPHQGRLLPKTVMVTFISLLETADGSCQNQPWLLSSSPSGSPPPPQPSSLPPRGLGSCLLSFGIALSRGNKPRLEAPHWTLDHFGECPLQKWGALVRIYNFEITAMCTVQITGKMKLVLLSAVLGLVWGLRAQAEVPVQPGLDVKQYSGYWYLVAVVSDEKHFLSTKDMLKMSIAVIKALDGGNLNIKMSLLGPEGCKKMEATLIKESQDGHYSNLALAQKDVRVVATDYVNFSILYAFSDVKGITSTNIQLYSRTQDVSPEGLKKFKEFYPTVGLSDDMMVMLPKSDACGKELLE
ncbi:LOW QUALITY PROTEIN: uncharacterized protein LOC119946558 [Tachyglossus aculeatus]|uniref:LOW QUALITY PROTEIN: uncharacterized protein LOC119946558 n=1 Tax=Tachyglossus aculeatus TaxID=9261 RepID=UPI0018F4CB61|nr:LOW QUALITY PROTEIN: uncharacterized protein LOC119946558 [Tachyglossus aculeatus]